ncbi:MAG: hypothetical protein JO035_00600 [Betaproteobacteria bacterium]|nr:hypothetical protein [Betaproteobacteria bacterium]
MKPSAAMTPHLATAAITVVFALVCSAFVYQATLSSFADDSVSYLVMAQTFSPWQSAGLPVREAFAAETTYPPLFPLVLALSGLSHDIGGAHVAVALLLAACLAVQYLVALRWLGRPALAVAAVAVTATLPCMWVHAKGILSEPLFLLVALLLLSALESRRRPVALALLFAALALTRTVGLVMVLAWAAASQARRLSSSQRWQQAWPALAAVGAYALWVLLRPAVPDQYASVVAENARGLAGSEAIIPAIAARVASQAQAMGEAWVAALELFRTEDRPGRTLVAVVLGLFAIAGLSLRLRGGKQDPWMMIAYLAVYLVWPYPAQMSRFLFPLVPILVLYAFYAAAALAERAPRWSRAAPLVAAAPFLALSAPALAFIAERARLGHPEGFSAITDWYTTPDLALARRRASVHLDLLEDMSMIREKVPPGERVMWVTPAYIALLADRPGVSAPSPELPTVEYLQFVQASGVRYVFLSRYHPRRTTSEADWRKGLEVLPGLGDALAARIDRVTGQSSSVLFYLRPTGALPTGTLAPMYPQPFRDCPVFPRSAA